MYIYKYIYIHMYMHTCMHIYAWIYIGGDEKPSRQVSIYIYIYVWIFLCMYIYTNIHTYAYVYVYIYVWIVWIHIGAKGILHGRYQYIFLYVWMYIYICMHTNIFMHAYVWINICMGWREVSTSVSGGKKTPRFEKTRSNNSLVQKTKQKLAIVIYCCEVPEEITQYLMCASNWIYHIQTYHR